MEKLSQWIAWHLPRRVVYWAAIRLFTRATQGRWSSTVVPQLTAVEALRRWSQP